MRIAPLFFCVALLLSGLVHIDGVRADAAFQTWLQALWPQAQSLGVSRGTFDAATNGLEPDFSLPDLVLPGRPQAPSRGQAEFVQTPADYLKESTIAGLDRKSTRLNSQS